MRLHPRYRCRRCGTGDTVDQTLAARMVRDIRDGLLVDRAGFLLPYCLTCRPHRLVDRIDLDDLLILDVRYGLHPGTTLRPYRPCRTPDCPVGRWPPPVGSRRDRTCPWCPGPAASEHRGRVDHEEEFALWAQELHGPEVRSS